MNISFFETMDTVTTLQVPRRYKALIEFDDGGGGDITHAVAQRAVEIYELLHWFKRFLAAGVLICLMLTASRAIAYPLNYGPFETGKIPASVSLKKCALIQQAGKNDGGVGGLTRFYRDKTHPQWTIKLFGTPEKWQISLLDDHGRNHIIGTATNGIDNLLIEVYSADLNNDTLPDYIVNIESGGCGLAAEMSEATFILSSASGYRARSFDMWDFGKQDLICINKKTYLVLTQFVTSNGDSTRDKRDHNFWVYQLNCIDGDRFVPANLELLGFPKWVWFSHKENHRETNLLTDQQKKTITTSTKLNGMY